MNNFGPRPTKEEWALWCEKNKDIWEAHRQWQEDYKNNPIDTLDKMLLRIDGYR